MSLVRRALHDIGQSPFLNRTIVGTITARAIELRRPPASPLLARRLPKHVRYRTTPHPADSYVNVAQCRPHGQGLAAR
jgi:hypothetical protein